MVAEEDTVQLYVQMDAEFVALIGVFMSTPLKLIVGVVVIASEKVAVILILSPFITVALIALCASVTLGSTVSITISF